MENVIVTETFVEYGIGMMFLVLRMFARLKFSGIRGLLIEDAFAGAAMVFWTLQSTIIYYLETLGSNIGLTTATALQVPDSQVQTMELGSKLAFMNWIWYMCYMWSLKAVLLWLFWRLTKGTKSQKIVLASAVFCLVSWLAYHCTLRQPLYVVICVLNVLSDLVVMIAPVLMLRKLQIPFQHKIILAIMFTSGFFIMICSILRCYYSLGDVSHLSIALQWADRECFLAAIVASLPGIKPIFRHVRWLGFSDYSSSRKQYSSQGYNVFASKNDDKIAGFSLPERSGKLVELNTMHGSTQKGRSSEESERPILNGDKNFVTSVSQGGNSPRLLDPSTIHITTEYSLNTEHGAVTEGIRSSG
ncbi:hypothetical protein N7495_001751 [Penicillium taxi]|uniref:uncharacterized protein n=1 Tax=Penicillium taxi TaxID=168475 RepID=UPI002544F2A7|nr:uncharacterized protein N7495_001751 [Penicillium taxi]KAJ5909069.1 hypothetical protein N7495_001751 [Penicillium taxi]